jgi:hypothetical protein
VIPHRTLEIRHSPPQAPKKLLYTTTFIPGGTILLRASYALGLRFRLKNKPLSGNPDLVFIAHRADLFVHVVASGISMDAEKYPFP